MLGNRGNDRHQVGFPRPVIADDEQSLVVRGTFELQLLKDHLRNRSAIPSEIT